MPAQVRAVLQRIGACRDARHDVPGRLVPRLDQAADCGVRRVQLIGGEPTMHPDALDLVDRALSLGLRVEVYSNLVHLSAKWWAMLQRDGVSLATSYYSDQADEHNAITGRRTYALTRANIEKAVRLGIPLRVGITETTERQRVDQACRELEALGVRRVSVDRARPFGRAAVDGQEPDTSGLCGRCGTGRAAISPTGDVSPCVFSSWMGVGNVREDSLAAILGDPAMADANASVRATGKTGGEDDDDDGCDPVGDGECTPGYPSSSCSPRN
ncbi:radical SAM/SPASM domain-containing protein [Streptomyces sparsogenes]|uniref:radical SAM/SPASM domain-containing protein n=1 Tax=Streptomyces sparsogenes TaxID=67365 RepID=UPI0033F5EAA0